MRLLAVGILAHVDAGKTTLAEAMMVRSGALRRQGRVDHRDALLDHHQLERARGITIFANQAVFTRGETAVTLLDTPGHADFSAEAERVLSVLDCAVLVISGTDGVQAHTETIWRLLRRYRVPAFLFITKQDLPGKSRPEILEELRRLDEGFLDFTQTPPAEDLALLDEAALETYTRTGTVPEEMLRDLAARRKLFPCYFGSGLRLEGVDRLLEGLEKLAPRREYPAEFGARVFKISRDPQGNRLTHLKVTGGTLRVRDSVRCPGRDGGVTEQKVSQLRIYSGAKYTQTDAVPAGGVCAVLGLEGTWPGQGLGAESESRRPVLEPVYVSTVTPPAGCDGQTLLRCLRELEEEDPQLRVLWEERTREVRVQLMGEIQGEILLGLLRERYQMDASLSESRILYKETVAAPVEGVGHFEPLRHYAEVHVMIEPLERGAGILFDSVCPGDELALSWQRLILTHLQEKQHLGVLIGAPLTDVKLTLVSGRAHVKHTEGGDFRQATYRAVRQGLMRAESVLLEPNYSFRLEVPREQLGRAVTDLRNFGAAFSSPEEEGEHFVLTGTVPVSAMGGYAREVTAYTRGRGRLFCTFGGYDRCRDTARVIAAAGYDPEADLDNTPDSVFCAHGAGFSVKWNKVPDYMHLEYCRRAAEGLPSLPPPRVVARNLDLEEKELQEIMLRTFGKTDRTLPRPAASPAARSAPPPEPAVPRKRHLVVDGYNVIFAWDELRELAEREFSLARRQFLDLLASYSGYTGADAVVVFDGYRVPGNPGETEEYHGIRVVYTKQDETADTYIQRFVSQIGKNETVRVVTSDSLIRLSALQSGILRETAKDFRDEVEQVGRRLAEIQKELSQTGRSTLSEGAVFRPSGPEGKN